jgi:competence protein ComEC
MGRATRGCGCVLAVLLVIGGGAALVVWKYVLPRWRTQAPPPSGKELKVYVLDVGPIDGDAILVVSPGGKVVLIDAGDTSRGKAVVEVLKRYEVAQIDYFIATHPHQDHLGGAPAVLNAVKVLNVIDNGLEPVLPAVTGSTAAAGKGSERSLRQSARAKANRPPALKFYDDYQDALKLSGAKYERAEAGRKYDLGDGARLTILAPTEPYFTKEQMKSGGNEPNANSIVVRLDYGEFSMLLPGDAEEQTEHRLLAKGLALNARILKVAHHGSKYATSADFLKRVQPQIAIISCGEWNRYSHPAQSVLDRLRAANIKVYRTDLEGEIAISTHGKDGDIEVKAAREAKTDVWTGRVGSKDDSSRSGFIAYGDFGPPGRSSK